MPKIFLSYISTQMLIIIFFSASSNIVKSELSAENPLMSSETYPELHQKFLQRIYPFLHDHRLTNNVKSLLRSLRRKRSRRRRLHRRRRKDGLVSSDLERNPLLVWQRQGIRLPRQPNYFYQRYLQPTGDDPQKFGLVIPGLVPMLPGAVNVVPLQPIAYNLERNSEIEKQLVYPSMVVSQQRNAVPKQEYLQPQIDSPEKEHQTLDLKSEARNGPDDKYDDSFISLPAIKSRNILTKDAASCATTSALASAAGSSSKSVSTSKASAVTQISAKMAELKSLNDSDGLVSALCSVVSALGQIFAVTRENASSAKPEDTVTRFANEVVQFSTALKLGQTSSTAYEANTKPIQVDKTGLENTASQTINKDSDLQNTNALSDQQIPISPVLSPTEEKNSQTDTVKNLPFDYSEPLTQSKLPFTSCGDTSNSSKIIEQILEDVEAIRLQESEATAREDLSCNITGSWSSLAGGMLLNISQIENRTQVSLSPKIPPSEKGFLIEPGWKLKGFRPNPKTDLLILTGVNEKDKHVTAFIGECRSCGGGETVTGNWLIGRVSRDCKDQRASQKVLSDVWSRETLVERRKERLKSIKEHGGSKKTVKDQKENKGN